jgi:hypothetical protein
MNLTRRIRLLWFYRARPVHGFGPALGAAIEPLLMTEVLDQFRENAPRSGIGAISP